jgi:3-methyladenine DNA glycosylase AlkC
MAEPLKHLLGPEAVHWLAGNLQRASAKFEAPAFVSACLHGLEALELKARAAHIADVLYAHLPQPFAAAAEVLHASLGPEAEPDLPGIQVLRYLPHVTFVSQYGLDDFEAAMRLQYELTKRFTAEFSIRAFIERYPEATYARLCEWARDDSVHVRRLVSEGTRPRLPWAPRLPAYQREPAPVLALLELLKDDPERYVQRSIANNLNDIGKDHPERVVELCARWLVDATPARQWIVRHALRSLIKAGHAGALALMGNGDAPRVRIGEVQLAPPVAVIGDKLRFSCRLESDADTAQELLVDFAVHYMKANGRLKAKVFKLTRLSLPAGESAALAGTISFRDMTTRRHYPGRHRIDLVINGQPFLLAEFDLRSR